MLSNLARPESRALPVAAKQAAIDTTADKGQFATVEVAKNVVVIYDLDGNTVNDSSVKSISKYRCKADSARVFTLSDQGAMLRDVVDTQQAYEDETNMVQRAILRDAGRSRWCGPIPAAAKQFAWGLCPFPLQELGTPKSVTEGQLTYYENYNDAALQQIVLLAAAGRDNASRLFCLYLTAKASEAHARVGAYAESFIFDFKRKLSGSTMVPPSKGDVKVILEMLRMEDQFGKVVAMLGSDPTMVSWEDNGIATPAPVHQRNHKCGICSAFFHTTVGCCCSEDEARPSRRDPLYNPVGYTGLTTMFCLANSKAGPAVTALATHASQELTKSAFERIQRAPYKKINSAVSAVHRYMDVRLESGIDDNENTRNFRM
jgi:hypothetical protein